MSKLSLSVGAEPTPTGPADLRDAKWLAERVALLSDGIDAARDIWSNWDVGRKVGRLHPTMSAGAYIESLGFHLGLVDAMAALPNASTREIAAVAGVSHQTVGRRRSGGPNGPAAAPPAKVIGADGKSYPGRVIRPASAEVIEPVDDRAMFTGLKLGSATGEPQPGPGPTPIDPGRWRALEEAVAGLEVLVRADPAGLAAIVPARHRHALAERIRGVHWRLPAIAWALDPTEPSTERILSSTSAMPPAGGRVAPAGPEALARID